MRYCKYSTNRQSYRLNYEVDKDHEIVQTVKQAFNIKTVLGEKCSIMLTHNQSYEINQDSESLNTLTNHNMRMLFGEYEEVGSVGISQTIGREDWKYE